ncbi:MAG: AraC family transcriptional regulator [Bacteroidota bacterium]|nr:AraC family transcriptional regulator [Bacteroidota bacterium]MDQ6889317.1 AraC family transcriptional regulator [Bacteroidota bacterium]
MRANFEYPLLPKNSSSIFLKTQGVENAPLHSHPNYEMNFVIKGNGTRYIGNNIGDFEEGDLILLAPSVPHRWQNTSKKQHDYSSLVIQWGENFLGRDWLSTPEFKDIRRLLELSVKGIKFDKYIGKEIKKKQSDLLVLPPFEKLVLLLQLLNELAKSNEFKILCDEEFSFNNHIPNSRLDIICNFIKEKYSEKITLANAATLVNMSEGAFSKFFSQTTKKPFFSFLNEYRIKMARKFLSETDMRANEIGYACGYECLQFFYRQFMKYAECSPQTYRKKSQIAV